MLNDRRKKYSKVPGREQNHRHGPEDQSSPADWVWSWRDLRTDALTYNPAARRGSSRGARAISRFRWETRAMRGSGPPCELDEGWR